jgi:cytochrome P450
LFDPDNDGLPYCRAVLTESIRLNMPVVFTTRIISKDLTLATGYKDDANGRSSRATILKGTRVIINPEMIHRDKRNFDRPLEFVPERWVRWDECTSGWVDRDYKTEAKSIWTEQHAPMSGTASYIAKKMTPPSLSSEYSVEHSHTDRIPAANPANFFAFSDGARNCVSRRLAMIELTLLIAEILRDLCVGLADRDFKMVKVLSFISISPTTLPLKFWKR